MKQFPKSSAVVMLMLTISICLLSLLAKAQAPNANPSANANSSSKLDMSLKPTQDSAETISQVFKEMVVVQRKAKEKANHFLLNVYENLDFSDGPTTLYGTNLSLGYALSDYFEVYANYVPFFISNARPIVADVNRVTAGQFQINYATPKSQFGVEILWAPAYGKDSWSPYTIIRSDTFFKVSAGQIQYNTDTGLRYSLVLGKTFFISQLFNLRLGAGGSYIQIPANGTKDYRLVGIVEAGLVWYL